MPKKELGKAQYKAFRNGDSVKIIAAGTAPGMNVKTDVEQLPFEIYPPMFGFYFIVPDIVLPALRPFVYEEDVPFPRSAVAITILDSEGKFAVKIKELATTVPRHISPAPSAPGYCVFSWIGTDALKIAKCDAALPAVYSRTFGPATYGECEKYVKDNGGQ
jgi:hypothetical protein